MATSTSRLGLTKPDYVDNVDIADLNGNADKIDDAVGFTICTSTTRPTSPYVGQAIFETDTLTGFTWDGSAWQVTSGASTTTADTPPSSPKVGDLWWDSTDGSLYVWYQDVDGSQWVGIRAASSSATIDVDDAQPGSPLTGNLWWNTDVESGQNLQVYNGSAFVPTSRLSNNAIINGDFGVWQRGTSFDTSAANLYTADRWVSQLETSFSGVSRTVTRQSFTPGDIAAIGYGDAEFYLRSSVVAAGSSTIRRVNQSVEDVRTFAGQTVTLSFWARSSTHTSIGVRVIQNFGSGGSAAVVPVLTTRTISSSWSRVVVTFAMPSVSGKTIGANSHIAFNFIHQGTDNSVFDLWGVQLEAGPVATPFKLAGGGSKAAELALCQRYYYRINAGTQSFSLGYNFSNALHVAHFSAPVSMRVGPTAVEQSGTATDYAVFHGAGTTTVCNGVPSFSGLTGRDSFAVNFPTGSGLTQGQGAFSKGQTSNAFLAWSAEL